MRGKELRGVEDVVALVKKWGFLPLFAGEIPGFSIEERTPRELWFNDEKDGPWEWKGPVLREMTAAYGKFFRRKAGYISLDWLADFANWRRHHYRMAGRELDTLVYETIRSHDSLLSGELKELCGFGVRKKGLSPTLQGNQKEGNPLVDMFGTPVRKPSRAPIEAALTRLQMAGYVVIADFEYKYDRQGNPYGWGVARYTTPEALYGSRILDAQGRTHYRSFHRILEHLRLHTPAGASPALIHFLRP